MPHKTKNLLLLILTLAPISFGSPVSWNLSDVTFSDGARATGSFQFDADSNTFGSWKINVTAGVLSAFIYTNANSSPFDGVQASGYQPTFFFSQNGSTRELRITPLTALTDAGGTVAINLNTWGGGSGSVECVDCTPYRNIVSGSLTTDSLNGVPEPGSMGLLGIGLVSFSIFAGRWKSRVTKYRRAVS